MRLTADRIDDYLAAGRIVNVCCTEHAAVRAIQRLGITENTKREVELLVREAIGADRWSRLQPEWSVSEGYEAREEERLERWVWTEDRTAVFAIALRRRSWRVKTCLAVRSGTSSEMIAR